MPTTNYIWDPVNDSVLMEKEENGTTTAVYLNGSHQFGRLISQLRNGQTYFHHYDGQYSTRTVTAPDQNVVESATYSAFGETVSKISSIANPFGFNGALGYYANPETNHVYVRARTLDPVIGRWLSIDPIGVAGGNANVYTYVENQPTQHSDPSGLQQLCGTFNATISATIGPGPIGQKGLGCVAVTDATIRTEVGKALAAQGFPRTISHSTGCPSQQVCCPVGTAVVSGVVSFPVVVELELPGPNCTLTIPITITAIGTASIGYCAAKCCLALPPIVLPPILTPLPPQDIGTIKIEVF